MRILIGSLTYPLRNGVTASINVSADGFLAAGHEIRIIAPDYGLGRARPEHCPVPHSIVGQFLLSLLAREDKDERMFAWNAPSHIRRLVRQFEPDAFWLHTVTWAPNAFERVMLASPKAKVLTYHTAVEIYGRIYAGELGARQMISRAKSLANRVDRVITPSAMIAKTLISYGIRTPISVIPTGLNSPPKSYSKAELAKRFDFAADRPLLLYVGRVTREKNIKSLFAMLNDLRRLKTEATLLLVGPGDLELVEQDAGGHKVADLTVFTGALPRADAQACYGGADAFVFASKTETQGLVISEAMLSGTPVVALDSPIRDEVYPEQIAKVVGNEAEFARAVREVIQDKKLRERLVKAARAYTRERFSIEQMIAKQISLFAQAIK